MSPEASIYGVELYTPSGPSTSIAMSGTGENVGKHLVVLDVADKSEGVTVMWFGSDKISACGSMHIDRIVPIQDALYTQLFMRANVVGGELNPEVEVPSSLVKVPGPYSVYVFNKTWDLPLNRTTVNAKNVMWLIGNLGIRNSNHPDYQSAMNFLKRNIDLLKVRG